MSLEEKSQPSDDVVDDADRGLVATWDAPSITAADGRTVWDFSAYDYLAGDCPPSVTGTLWQHAQRCARHGLYEVVDGVYQVRGFDLSNMTIVEGQRGVIVIDPLISAEVAAAGLELYRRHRGDRPVSGVIYSHSHVDHFAGVGGVLPDGRGDVPIIAPQGFLEHAVAENVYAGTAMQRRGRYMSGGLLPVSTTGQVSAGMGAGTSTGTVGLIAPSLDIVRTGQEETVDGVRMVFQLTPDSEAPAEMNFLLPDHQVLCVAELATQAMHNIQTPRGALVRDARLWAHYLGEAIELFSDDTDVLVASHHWPTWGQERIVRHLSEQRDTYAYLHDQTLRMMNRGSTGIEIAEELRLPPALESARHVRGHYGSVSHNVKAIYHRYMGWFDGNPTSLWRHPPQAAAERYVHVLGGVEAVIARGREYAVSGDLRFAAELLTHAVFAEPSSAEARIALADVYEQLGFGAENAIWRNFYLSGALELREGVAPPTRSSVGPGMAGALTAEQLLSCIAIRVDGLRAATEHLVVDWRFTDLGVRYRTELSNGALVIVTDPRRAVDVDLTVQLTKQQLLGILAGRGVEGIDLEGDAEALTRLMSVLDDPDPTFAIVTP